MTNSISVIMNCYLEREKYFHEAVQSILSQTNVNVHLILSTVEGDPCIKWIRHYEGDIEVFTIEKNRHPGKSPDGSFLQLNEALKVIKHDWFCFASSNDVLFDHKLNKEIALCVGSGKLVCYSGLRFTDENLNFRKDINFPPYSYSKHLIGNFIPDTSIINYKELGKYLPFKTKWYNCGYWDFWLRVYEAEGNVFINNPEPLVHYRQSNESMHIKRRSDLTKKEIYNNARKLMIERHVNNGNGII